MKSLSSFIVLALVFVSQHSWADPSMASSDTTITGGLIDDMNGYVVQALRASGQPEHGQIDADLLQKNIDAVNQLVTPPKSSFASTIQSANQNLSAIVQMITTKRMSPDQLKQYFASFVSQLPKSMQSSANPVSTGDTFAISSAAIATLQSAGNPAAGIIDAALLKQILVASEAQVNPPKNHADAIQHSANQSLATIADQVATKQIAPADIKIYFGTLLDTVNVAKALPSSGAGATACSGAL